MLAIWFTCGRDAACLIESVAAFRAVGGSRVALVEDARDPLPASVKAAILPDLLESSTWPTRNGLYGWPCVLGMLESMERACSALDEPGCLKIDSDTLVLSVDWLDRSAPHCGFVAGSSAFACGMAFWLRADAIATVLASLRGRWLSPARRVSSSTAIGNEVLWRYGPACLLHSWSTGWAGGWAYGRVPAERYAKCQVITFGEDPPRPADPAITRRDAVAATMAAWRANPPTAARPANPLPAPNR